MDLAEDILLAAAATVWAVGAFYVSGVDIKEQRLPTKVIVPTAIVVLAIYIATTVVIREYEPIFWALVGGLACYSAFYALYLISRELMGGGDVRLAGLNGLLVGWFGPADPWISLVIALILAFPSALILFVFRGPKSQAPFGPFMVAGTAVVAGIRLSGVEIF